MSASIEIILKHEANRLAGKAARKEITYEAATHKLADLCFDKCKNYDHYVELYNITWREFQETYADKEWPE